MNQRFTWPDERLIKAAQDGDVTSLTTVVMESQPHVRRFAMSLCSSPQDAEDAAQEALIILYRKIGTLRATSALASWMFRIVRNECLRQVRLLVSRSDEATAEPMCIRDRCCTGWRRSGSRPRSAAFPVTSGRS